VPLVSSGFIAIPPGARPGFDHADVYQDGAGAALLCVAHTGADRVDVIDCAASAWLRALPGHPGVAGVLVDQGTGLLFTSDRAAAKASIYQCQGKGEELLARVVTGPHPNALAFDAARRRLFTFNLGEPLGENCTASVISLDSPRVTATIALPGRPRWAVWNPATDQVVAAIRDPAQIIVIGAAPLAIDRVIDVPAAGPHGVCTHRGQLYCAADGRALVVLDHASGAVRATLPLPGAPDVIMHDPRLSRLYIAIGDPGVICVADTRHLEITETVPTEHSAHTLAIDPRRHAVYAFLPASHRAAVYLDR
jgi:DNA-binding beta-propeller fold protein YncE